MANDDEVLISARLQDGISAATARINKRVEELEQQVQDLARTFRKAGVDAEQGLGQAEEAAEDVGKASRRARPPVKQLGDEAARTGAKATAGAAGLDTFANKAKKAGSTSRQSGRLLMTSFKFAGLVTGAFAFAGGLSAIGAGGAIAVGGLAPMLGILAAVPGLFLAAKLGMWAFKLSGEQLTPMLDQIKSQFTDLAPFVAGGGLASGMQALADSTLGLAQASGIGLRGIGAEIGEVARETGRWVRSEPALAQIQAIFEGLRPVTGNLARGVLALLQAFLNMVQMSLPVTQKMGEAFYWIANGLRSWTAQNLANGRGAAWLSKAWLLFIGVVEVLVDVTIGVYNVLRIAAGYAYEFGAGMESSAQSFRRWTESAEGQARINQYFQESLPALREMGRLLGMIVGGFGSLAANQNVAPLLEQIRTEFAPALGELVAKLSGQGGLGPALITAATAMVTLFATLDFSGLTAFIVAVGQLAAGIAWIAQNVPGANFLIGALLASMLGFKILGPVFTMLGSGAAALSWVWGAAQGVDNLSKKQKMFKGILSMVHLGLTALGTAFKTMAIAGVTALRTLSIALFTTPVGWIILGIMAIIAGIILLWNNCEWFRDAVTAAWEWIKNAAVTAWEWIVNAVVVSVAAIGGFFSGLVDWLVSAWQWVKDAASSTWSAVTGFVSGAVDTIGTIFGWLWTNIIEPVWNVIATGAKIYFGIVAFVVQTAIYVIVAIVAFLAWIFEAAWNDISNKAKYVFEKVIMPVVEFFRSSWESLTSWVSEKWTWLTTAMAIAWNLFYSTYIEPVVLAFRIGWEMLSNWVSEKWTWLTTAMAIAWNIFYTTYIQPVIDGFSEKWTWLTTLISIGWAMLTGYLSDRWNGFKDTIGGVIEWASRTWGDFTSWLGSVFAPVGSAISAIWEGIQKAASNAADIVKGAWDTVAGAVKSVWNFIAGGWNSIPSITVPDWVPGMGGNTFSLPKLPMLWKGGEAPGGMAVVGEHGPEPLVKGGQVVGMVGANGPEVTSLPKGGYVVPNLSTLNALPGLTKSLPAGVAAAVARSVPGYAGALGSGGGSGGGDGLRRAVERLAESMSGQAPPVHLHGSKLTTEDVTEAWRRYDRERKLRKKYDYAAGGR